MPVSISCFSFFLDSCNLVKWPLEQSVQCYSRLHLSTDVVSNASEKADKKSQLNALEMVNSVARQVQEER